MKSPPADHATESLVQDLSQTRAYLEHLHHQMTSLSKDVVTLSSDVRSIFRILQTRLGSSLLTLQLHQDNREAGNVFSEKGDSDAHHQNVGSSELSKTPKPKAPPSNANGNHPVVGILKSNVGGQVKTPPLHRVDFAQQEATTHSAPSSAQMKTRPNATSRSRSYADIFHDDDASAPGYDRPENIPRGGGGGGGISNRAFSCVRRSQTGNSFNRIHAESPPPPPSSLEGNLKEAQSRTRGGVETTADRPTSVGVYTSRTERDLDDDDSVTITSTRGDSGIDVGKEIEFGSRSTILSTDL